MASRQNRELVIANFGGGRVSVKMPTSLASNEFANCDNIIVLPGGNGFRRRYGDTAFNNTAVSGGNAIQGLGYFKPASGTEYLVTVATTEIYSSTLTAGTFSTITGTTPITSGRNNLWQIIQFNNLAIGVGGAPDAPWKYTGTGNASALGGSPPSGSFGFTVGNRMFIGGSAALPSRIYWSLIGNPEDWSSTGSGNADVQTGDGDALVCGVPLNINNTLLFKQNSIHSMTGRTSPFPVFPLFTGVGAAGKNAAIAIDGLVYFVTPSGRLRITDGARLFDEKDFPALSFMDDVWNTVNVARLPYLSMTRRQGADYDHLVISVTKDAVDTNDYAFIWDLTNKCWLNNSTGWESNAYATTQSGDLYAGAFNGKVYKKDVAGTYTDASNVGTAIAFSIESDWLNQAGYVDIVKLAKVVIAFTTQAGGTMTFSYGYDRGLTQSKSFSIASSGATWDVSKWDQSVWGGYTVNLYPATTPGRGNLFKWKLSGNSTTGNYLVSGVSLFGRDDSQKNFSAS